MKPTIVVASASNGAFAITIPGEAIRLKTEALNNAKHIVRITNPDEQENAIAAVSILKGLTSGLEKSRESVKKPYWDAGKAIDAKAKEYAKELDERAAVIERMIGDYQKAERAKAEAERLAAETKRKEAEAELLREQRKAAKAEADRLAAEKAAEEAEARRIQAEIEAAEAKTASAKKKAQAELAKREQEAEDAKRAQQEAEDAAMQSEIDASEAQDAHADASATVVGIEAPKASGASIREKIEFEIEDIDLFYAWDLKRRAGKNLPSFVKLEIKKADFNAYIQVIGINACQDIPGVTFTASTKAAVRAATPSQFSLQ